MLTRPHSRVITDKVLALAWEAGGDDKACVIFALLACRKLSHRLTQGVDCRYFRQRSLTDLDESELHRLRMQGCERMAKLMIDSITSNDAYLFTDVLLRR
jgi:hypothetical protein